MTLDLNTAVPEQLYGVYEWESVQGKGDIIHAIILMFNINRCFAIIKLRGITGIYIVDSIVNVCCGILVQRVTLFLR